MLVGQRLPGHNMANPMVMEMCRTCGHHISVRDAHYVTVGAMPMEMLQGSFARPVTAYAEIRVCYECRLMASGVSINWDRFINLPVLRVMSEDWRGCYFSL